MRNKVVSLIATVLVCVVTASVHAAEKLHEWKYVNADPCNPKVGCTLEWALQNAREKVGWPNDIVRDFIRVVKTENPETVSIRYGWEGWMTSGKVTPKFWPHTIAAFKDKAAVYYADAWYIKRGNRLFRLLKIHACGNWGGDDFVILAVKPKSPTSEGKLPLGTLPVVTCLGNSH